MHPTQLRLLGALLGAGLVLAALAWVLPEGGRAEGLPVHRGFELGDARSLVLDRREGGQVRLEKRDGIWWVTAPFESQADPDLVFGVLDAIRGARWGRPVRGELVQFGLEPPVVTAVVEVEGAEPVRLVLGDTAPVGLRTYARVDGEVLVVEGHPADLLTKPPREYRDHKVFRYDPGDVRRIAVQSPGGLLEAIKGEHGWYLTGFSRVDLDALDDWIVDLLRLRVDMFLELDEATIDDPRYRVEVETSGGVQRLQVGRETPYGTLVRYGDGVYGVIHPDVLAMLRRGPTDVGDPNVFPWDPDHVERVRLEGAVERVLTPPWEPSPLITALETAAFVYRRDPPTWTGAELTVYLEGGGKIHPVALGPIDAEGFRPVRDLLGGEAMRVPADEVAPLFAGG